VKALVPQHSGGKEKEPFVSVFKGDVKGARQTASRGLESDRCIAQPQ
jgi:hypothetical protein